MAVFEELFASVKFILWDYIRFATMAFVLFYLILKKPLWFRKIQKKMPKLTDYGRDIVYSITSVAIFAIVNTITFYYLIDYTNVYDNISDYGMLYYIFTWVWMFFLGAQMLRPTHKTRSTIPRNRRDQFLFLSSLSSVIVVVVLVVSVFVDGPSGGSM